MPIKLEKRGKLAIVTLNYSKLNALGSKALRELNLVLVNMSRGVKVVILTGTSKHFISGGDLAEMSKLKDVKKFVKLGKSIVKNIINSPQIIIAAVNGYALGAGCEICCACDMVISGNNAKFGQPEVKLGIVPGFGGMVLLPMIVGRKAKELIFRGNVISSREAYRIGLVNYVVTNPLKEAVKIGKEISANSGCVAVAKKFINYGLDEGFNLETKEFVKCFKGKDRVEGMKAFFAKRKPRF